MNKCIICDSDCGFDLICKDCKDAIISMRDYTVLLHQIRPRKEKDTVSRKADILRKLNALNEAMRRHNCYICNHDFINLSHNFGTNIVSETIEFIESIPDEEE